MAGRSADARTTASAKQIERRPLTLLACHLDASDQLDVEDDVDAEQRVFYEAAVDAVKRAEGINRHPSAARSCAASAIQRPRGPTRGERSGPRCKLRRRCAAQPEERVERQLHDRRSQRARRAAGPRDAWTGHSRDVRPCAESRRPARRARAARHGRHEPGDVRVDGVPFSRRNRSLPSRAAPRRARRPCSAWAKRAPATSSTPTRRSSRRSSDATRSGRSFDDCGTRRNTAAAAALVVTGDPGIGKSRLVQTVKDTVIEERNIRLTCQCRPHFKNGALHPVIELINVKFAGVRRSIGIMTLRARTLSPSAQQFIGCARDIAGALRKR